MVRKALNIFLGVIATGLLAALGLFLFVSTGLSGPLPTPETLKNVRNPLKTQVFDQNGTLFGTIYSENRILIPLDEMPESLISALISTEDARFFSHHGIDFLSLPRVFIKGVLFASSSAGGGSTITQQLAKNLYPRQRYLILSTPVNKLREMVMAHRIESVFSKTEILEQYLNTVPFGELVFGIGTAAQRFFGKEASDLRPEECATLIGMLKAPTYYSPRRFPDRALARRNTVLSQMSKFGGLAEAARDSLQNVPLAIRYTPDIRASELSGYCLAYIEKEVRRILSESRGQDSGDIPDPKTDGLRIYTTIDLGLQRHAEEAIKTQMPKIQASFNKDWAKGADWETWGWKIRKLENLETYHRLARMGLSKEEILKELGKTTKMSVFSWSDKDRTRDFSVADSLLYYNRLLQTGMIALDPASGQIKCWVGGIDHRYFPFDHVLAKRQAGSAFKPFLYSAALESGVEVCSYYDNQRVTLEEYDDWSPRNSSNTYGGSYSLQGALTYSVNTVAAELIKDVGPDNVIDVARRLGITSDIPAVPSIALGTAEVSLMEMASAYCGFVNGGIRVQPFCILKIEDHEGRLLYESKPSEPDSKVISDSISNTVLNMMQTVVDSGTAQALRGQFGLKVPLAGKTGTTQKYTDGWFVGITPGLVVGSWVGADDPAVHFRTGAGAGGNTALRICGQFLLNALRNSGTSGFLSDADGKSRFTSGSPLCPLYSDLPASDMMAILDNKADSDWSFGEFIESIFEKKEDNPEAEEQRLLRQMQKKLDKTAVRLRKRKKSPMEIKRTLDEIRKDYYARIDALRDETTSGPD